ncbi:hypothetical protein J3E74DRAFT_227165 [Bipolaris maydis]|nr:hypothetical protein J3E74DRAFT_227165 [Bipolaris maydis]
MSGANPHVKCKCFHINLPIGGLVAGSILISFKTPSAAPRVQATHKEKILQMDFPGTALVMRESLCLLQALQYGGITHPWKSSLIISLLVGFSLMVIAFIIVEIWQGERAMRIPRLMRQRTVWVNSVWVFPLPACNSSRSSIYSQSVDNRSAISSSVCNISLIGFSSIAPFGCGKTMSKTGIATSILMASSVVVTISASLLYTLDIGTSTGKWVGYQILVGFGYGMGLQIPLVIVPAFAAPTDIAPVTGTIIYATFTIAAAQSGFDNQLLRKLHSTAPYVGHSQIISTGATALRRVFYKAELDGVISAYAGGIKVAFAITIASCSISALTSLAPKWDNTNKTKAST